MDIKIEKKPFLIRYKFYILGAIVTLGLVIYVLFGAVGPSRLKQDKDSLQIVEVKNDKFLEYLDVECIVQPQLTMKLNSLESGFVQQIMVEDGSLVNKGDTILILTNPELINTINEERDNYHKQLLSHKEKLLQMEQKTSELKRSSMKTLYDLNRLSKQYELDKEEYAIGIKSKAQLDISTEEYNYNTKNTTLLLKELEQDSVKNIYQKELLKSDIAREEQKYEESKKRLDDLIVRAPIHGQLSFLSVIPGERVNAGVNIGELKDLSTMKLTGSVSEYYIERITLGLPAFINSNTDKTPLTISKINPEIKDRNFVVDFKFVDKVPDNTRIGKTFRVQVEMGQSEDAIVINKGNFYTSTGGKWIYKLNKDGSKASKVNITIGRQNPQQYEIIEGLEAGDKVIIAGYDYFGDAQELIF